MAKSKKSLKKILPKLTESNYYSKEADLHYMSVSQYKSFMNCEARTMAKLNGEYEEEKNSALLFGSYIDSYFEGTLDDFKANNPDLFVTKKTLVPSDEEMCKSNPEWYTKNGRLKAEMSMKKIEELEPDYVKTEFVGLKAEFAKADEIIKLIESNELFMKFMSGEKQVILTFKLFGVWWKIKMDSFIRKICITDLKIMKDTKSIPKWRYDTQGAIYQKGVELNDLGKLPFYLAVATKEDIPDLNIFQIPQSTLDLALMEVEENLPHIIEVKTGKIAPTRCEKCDYCKRTRKVRIRNYNELLE